MMNMIFYIGHSGGFLHKIGHSGRFLDRPFGPLLKTGLPLIGNVLKPLAKSVLIPLGLTATDAANSQINFWI